jgi:hypothetical protein
MRSQEDYLGVDLFPLLPLSQIETLARFLDERGAVIESAEISCGLIQLHIRVRDGSSRDIGLVIASLRENVDRLLTALQALITT